jgi:hypothetical protein
MRFLSLIVIASSILITSAFAEDVDYSKIHFSRFAPAERAQFAKCITNMLMVVERHDLRAQLYDFLDAGCAAERETYRIALMPYMDSELHFQDAAAQLMAVRITDSMLHAADGYYMDKSASFCSGDTCVLDAYRKCIRLQNSNEITKRMEPREFEKVAQQRCGTSGDAARNALTTDFGNAQKLQIDRDLSGKTRDLIDKVITGIRHEIVISYSEELTKLQPGRRSCKPACETCISLDVEAGPEPEYRCAIGEIGPPQ